MAVLDHGAAQDSEAASELLTLGHASLPPSSVALSNPYARSSAQWIPAWIFDLCRRGAIEPNDVVQLARQFVDRRGVLLAAATFVAYGISLDFDRIERQVNENNLELSPSEPGTAEQVVVAVSRIANLELSERSVDLARLALESMSGTANLDEAELAKSYRLGSLAITIAEMAFIRTQIDAQVEQSRMAGDSWAEIGLAVGVNASTAQRRWNLTTKAHHREYQRRRYGRTD